MMLVALIISGQGAKEYNINIKSISLFKTSIK